MHLPENWVWIALLSIGSGMIGAIFALASPWIANGFAKAATKRTLRSGLIEALSNLNSTTIAYYQTHESKKRHIARHRFLRLHRRDAMAEEVSEYDQLLERTESAVIEENGKLVLLWNKLSDLQAKVDASVAEISSYWGTAEQTNLENYLEGLRKDKNEPFAFDWDTLSEKALDEHSFRFSSTFQAWEVSYRDTGRQTLAKFARVLK